MLDELISYGDWLIENPDPKQYIKELTTIQKDDEISLGIIDDKGRIHVKEVFKYGDKINHFYFYKGGNDSVGGSLGIQGQSPFFLNVKFFTDKKNDNENFLEIINDKMSRSRDGFNKIFKGIKNTESSNALKNYSDDFIDKYFNYLKEEDNLNKISSLKTEWLFIEQFQGINTDPLHNRLIFHWFGETRKKSVGYITGTCSVCGKYKKKNLCEGIGLIFPRLPFFVLEKAPYNFCFQKDNLSFSKFKICEKCAEKAVVGWEILTRCFGDRDFLIIPTVKQIKNQNSLETFHKIISENTNKFKKLNSVLKEHEIYKYYFINFLVVGKDRGQVKYIEKYVRNYKSFAINFQDIKLAIDKNLEYVDFKSDIKIEKIYSYFDIEKILKFFFRDENNSFLPPYFHFYKLYHSDDSMRGLPDIMDSSFKHRLYKYRDKIFSFLYEVNPENLDPETLNDICLNFLLYEIRNMRRFWDDESYLGFTLMEGLNYYYFLLNKFKGETKLKENVINLKNLFEEFDGNRDKIKNFVDQDKILVFYLIGQFIRKIDNYRYQEKKNKIFNEFIQAVNRRNIEERFANDILIKQNYYIERLNKKAKFIFDLLSNYLEEIFEYESYNRMIISLITGYYSKNYLKDDDLNE